MHLSSRDSRLNEAPRRSLRPSMSLEYLPSPFLLFATQRAPPALKGSQEVEHRPQALEHNGGWAPRAPRLFRVLYSEPGCLAAICESCSELWVWRAGWFIDRGSHKLEF